MKSHSKRTAADRARLIAEARCIECRKFAAVGNRCMRCTDKNRQRSKAAYERRKASAACVSCGGVRVEGKIRCALCTMKIADANARNGSRQRYRERSIALGKCVDCARPRGTGQRCTACALRNRERCKLREVSILDGAA